MVRYFAIRPDSLTGQQHTILSGGKIRKVWNTILKDSRTLLEITKCVRLSQFETGFWVLRLFEEGLIKIITIDGE